MSIAIISNGCVTSVGHSAIETAAAVRAGINRFMETPFISMAHEPVVMAHLKSDTLPPADSFLLDFPGISMRQVRMLRIAGRALSQTCQDLFLKNPTPIFLGTSEHVAPNEQPDNRDLLNLLSDQSGIAFDYKASRIYPQGRASTLLALAEASELLKSGKFDFILVGGMDSFFDEDLLQLLDKEGRIASSVNLDGFIPGEGAGFLLLSSLDKAKLHGVQPVGIIEGVSVGFEKGHRYSKEPYLGEGLADTMASLFKQISIEIKLTNVYGGFNGENYDAKQWGVAFLRNHTNFPSDFIIEHPADRLGDTGAAMGPIMIILSILSLQKGYQSGSSLIWCTSDYGHCGTVLIH